MTFHMPFPACDRLLQENHVCVCVWGGFHITLLDWDFSERTYTHKYIVAYIRVTPPCSWWMPLRLLVLMLSDQ